MNPILQAFCAGAGGFVVVFLLLFLFRRRNKSAAAAAAAQLVSTCDRSISPPDDSSSFTEGCFFDPSLPPLSLPLISSATRDFHQDLVVGDGSFGLVYKALLPDGTPLAVKSLSPDASHGLREFRAEVETLSRLRHPNLCRFLGYCSKGPLLRLLLYEFLPLGSLDLWLHESPPSPPLPFSTRLRVIRGVSTGLAFLHHGCSPPVIHRDIKSSNVLLDYNFEARIADFGLARHLHLSRSHVSTQVAGTMGYMPPEYRDGATIATAKADVYSFGVLMLEVLTGRRPNLLVPVGDGVNRVAIVCWARMMAEAGTEHALAEKGMEPADEDVLRAYVAVALDCTREIPKHRPSMTRVAEMLDQVPAT